MHSGSRKDVGRDFNSHYVLGKKIGYGNFANVYEAIQISSKRTFAAKATSVSGEKSELAAKSIERELRTMKNLNHPNIVKLLDSFESRVSTSEYTVFIIFELISGGDLYSRLKMGTKFNEKDARCIVMSLLSAVEYLHDNNIVHRCVRSFYSCQTLLRQAI